MKRILFAAAAALVLGATAVSAQVIPPRVANSDIENMKLEELQFLLEQRRQQLSQVNAQLNAAKAAAQQKDAWINCWFGNAPDPTMCPAPAKPADPAPAAPTEEKKQ